jgi:hypothetical protein
MGQFADVPFLVFRRATPQKSNPSRPSPYNHDGLLGRDLSRITKEVRLLLIGYSKYAIFVTFVAGGENV